MPLFQKFFSPSEKFPQSAFAPYEQKDYNWNPLGSEISLKKYDFPVVALSNETTLLMQQQAASNELRGFEYPLFVAEFDLVMQTTKADTRTSESCLSSLTCLPLGGFSVWSALPPLNLSFEEPKKPIILAMASMDAVSFFRDDSVGGDSPLSGMIALLAAVDALSRVKGLRELPKQLIFFVATGESWGYLGSRRFLKELQEGSSSTKGLNISLLHQVLEIGSVGRSLRDEKVTLFAHSDKQLPLSAESEEILSTLQKVAQNVENLTTEVRAASDVTPGIPPSSFMSFLHQNSSIPGVVLEEFDSSFINPYFQSLYDTVDEIDPRSIASVAEIVAKTLFLLSGGTDSKASEISVNSTLIHELFDCLLKENPGFTCPLVTSFITAQNLKPNHYSGVFIGPPPPPSDVPSPETVEDTSRFVWNFLADRTGESSDSGQSEKEFEAENLEGKNTGDFGEEEWRKERERRAEVGTEEKDNLVASGKNCTEICEVEGEVCVGSKGDSVGKCIFSTTRYVPAYSTRLEYVENFWKILSPSSVLEEIDPIWTESFWQKLSVRSFLQDSSKMDTFLFGTGVIMTATSIVVIGVTKTLFRKRLSDL